jgi:hypothetical protein
MSAEEDGMEQGDVRFPYIYDAFVVDNEDPKGIGRVRARIPGLSERTPWALPVGTFGGKTRRGLYSVPPLGASVAVFFNQGDPQAPRYLGGYWGSAVEGAADDGSTGAETPERARDAQISERPKITTLETERWAIVLDDRAMAVDEQGVPIESVGQDSFIILHKPTGQNIEIDGGRQGITITGTTIVIKAKGALTLDGLVVNIAGRKVRKNAGVIS